MIRLGGTTSDQDPGLADSVSWIETAHPVVACVAGCRGDP